VKNKTKPTKNPPKHKQVRKKDQKSIFSFPVLTELQHYTLSKLHKLYTKVFLTPPSLLQTGRPNLRQQYFHTVSCQLERVTPLTACFL